MSDEGKFLLIAVPRSQKEDTTSGLKKKCEDNGLLVGPVIKFAVPDFTVGTLDSLLSLSDELKKIDFYCESVIKRMVNALQDAFEDEIQNKKKEDFIIQITYNSANYTIPKYLSIFSWDEAKIQKRLPLKTMTAYIHMSLGKFDQEIKIKSTNYSNVQHSISAEVRKTGGNLSTKDFSDFVQKEHMVESEYLETVFVAVPKYGNKEFLATYESWIDMAVVPRSHLEIASDNDFILYRIVCLAKKMNDFKNQCRERKVIVRDFKFTSKNSSTLLKQLNNDREDAKQDLIRWCKANLSEAFIAWIHLKTIRVFVECVLRYGLPTNFETMLLQPKKGKEQKLREILNTHYSYLGNKSVFSKIEQPTTSEDVVVPVDDEEMFSYVSVDISTQWTKQW